MTAVCRPSLHLAPGALFRAAAMSGSGAGKGLLVRCICMIANGRAPHAVTKAEIQAVPVVKLLAEHKAEVLAAFATTLGVAFCSMG